MWAVSILALSREALPNVLSLHIKFGIQVAGDTCRKYRKSRDCLHNYEKLFMLRRFAPLF